MYLNRCSGILFILFLVLYENASDVDGPSYFL